MSFVDVEFVFFFPAVLLLYWLLPRTRIVQNSVLLLASWVFYAGWNWRLLPLLIGGAVLDYLVGRYMGARPASDPAQRGRRMAALAVSLAWNLGALAYFKYAGFFAHSFNRLMDAFGLGASMPELQIILPLGISFYTLQRVGYIVDVYYERIAPSRSPLDFLLFTGFFPQLTAGPIARGAELLPQFAQPRRLRPETIASAAVTFLLGYMLKAWVADSTGTSIVNPVFDASDQYSPGVHWLALVAYAVQVFADFAGYSLLAIGTARFFGIELPINFDSPFLSRSLPEFWRRWHITLNRWLFDYIYNPLVSGSGWFRGRFMLTLVLVFLASGLWHGAALTFISWGLMHGVGMAVHRAWDEYLRTLCRKDRKYVMLRKSAGYALVAWALTQFYFMLSLIPFRAYTLSDAALFAKNLFISDGHRPLDLGAVLQMNELLCVGFVVLLHVLDLPAVRGTRERLLRVPAPIRGMAYGAVIVYLFLFVPVGASTFIYRQF